MSESIEGDLTWTENLENFFASTGEKSYCLSWIHKKAEEMYSHRRTFIDLPVIAISSITGFCSVGSSTMFDDQKMASIILGLCSLVVSVLNTTGSYFGWAKRAEGHRISSIQYERLFRFLSIEMSLPREERMTPVDLLKHTKDQYDRLAEISPLIPPEIIKDFQHKFKDHKDISMPSVVNGLEQIRVFAPPQTPSTKMKSLPSETTLDARFENLSLSSPILKAHPSELKIDVKPTLHPRKESVEGKSSAVSDGLTTVPSTE